MPVNEGFFVEAGLRPEIARQRPKARPLLAE